MSKLPLPTHDGYINRVLIDDECNNRGTESVRAWTEQRLFDYGAACRAAAFEEAANLCAESEYIYGLKLASAIRALKDQKREQA